MKWSRNLNTTRRYHLNTSSQKRTHSTFLRYIYNMHVAILFEGSRISWCWKEFILTTLQRLYCGLKLIINVEILSKFIFLCCYCQNTSDNTRWWTLWPKCAKMWSIIKYAMAYFYFHAPNRSKRSLASSTYFCVAQKGSKLNFSRE